MANQIYPGTMGPGTFVHDECDTYFGDHVVGWWVVHRDFVTYGDADTPNGWGFDPATGTITVPTTASIRSYYLNYVLSKADCQLERTLEFEVVAPDPSCDATVSLSYEFVPDVSNIIRIIAAVGAPGISTIFPATFVDSHGYSFGVHDYDGGMSDVTLVNSNNYTLLLGESETFTVTVTPFEGCPPIIRTLTVTRSGRYICSGDDCTFDPTAVSPTGFATLAECVAACSASGDCALGGSLAYATVSGIQKRVTATATGTVGSPTYAFSSPSSGIPNDTSNTCLVNVGVGETLLVTVVITDGDCSATRSITVSGDSDTGASACTLAVGLTLINEGGGGYRVTAALTGVTGSSPTVSFYLDTVLTAPDSGTTLTVHVPYGETKNLVVVAMDGSCAAGDVLSIGNADSGGGGVPEVPFDDGCVARLGVYYRDFKAETDNPDAVIFQARFGLEVRPDCTNPACAYWWQLFDSSDASLFEVYTDDALKAHFPVAWTKGEAQTASGDRIERYQILGSAISRPATQHKHLRLKATPVYQQQVLAQTGNIVKIRDLGERSLFLFQGGAKVLQWTAPDAGTYGPGTVTAFPNQPLSTATDAAILDDKIYVIGPSGVYILDANPNEVALASGVFGETRTPVFVEAVGTKPLVIYQDNAATPKTRCYDFSFPAPRLVWEASFLVTVTQVADGKLLLAAGASLYTSAAGTGTPTLQHTFGANITALAKDYVGLADNHIWKNKSSGWASVETMVGPPGALWPWYGGAPALRALAGAASGSGANKLRAEQPTLNWADDITLAGATGIKSMRALEVEVVAGTETSPAVNDEWVLIGDNAANLWIYSRAAISEADGAFQACAVASPRLFPFLRRKDN